MNRYPLWKYIVIVVTLLLGALYTAPNYFGQSPALQISSGKTSVRIGAELVQKVESALQQAQVPTTGIAYDSAHASVRARFTDPDTQFRAKSVLEKSLNADTSDPNYLVALNLLSDTPKWMQSLHALPMYLGLDLRGGVHFLMQVDTKAVLDKKLQGVQAALRSALRDKSVQHSGIARVGDTIEVSFRDEAMRSKGRDVIAGQGAELRLADTADGAQLKTVVTLKPEALKQTISDGVAQNISTLSKRVNELGVAEPIIQQQGADRIVVQLPGEQDVARARAVIGRTASLEVHMVDETVTRGTEMGAAIPLGSQLYTMGRDAPAVLYKEVVLTGDYITSATAGQDENNQPAVFIDLNSVGGRKMSAATSDRVGKHMAIVLIEKTGKPEVISVATLTSELNAHFRTTGVGTAQNAADLALMLRSGALSAPMEIIEERTIGPQLGAENIAKGFSSTVYGFAAIAVFMIGYYMLFGFFSVLALACNLLLLLALLSRMQATLTLPGIAAIALALGMAIDANVLINERIREELRGGATPQQAIAVGFDRAWATILDSNVTTLIVGVALWVFGSGAIRGFAVVHCLGILTSMFSAVFVSRGVVNLWYGRRKKLASLSIGTVWRGK
ncbi:protein translocase subunit SecD [Janthinobacterium sp. HH01]|uniref:protein translocase subunit SecD n=1 Tax=Janthinobacterium sp. HH01 TaxID=1198452 RepID=UPI0002AE8FD8|nr:protein translocase subunit SecD [Janthinobacterium sp. HH01]ELX13532.1 protein translocase subunit SecD [Janthinobacterium sp. HH01]